MARSIISIALALPFVLAVTGAFAEAPPAFPGVSYAAHFPMPNGQPAIAPAVPSAAERARWNTAALEITHLYADAATIDAGKKKLEALPAGAWPALRAAPLKMDPQPKDRLDEALPAYLYRTSEERETIRLAGLEYQRTAFQVAYEQFGQKDPRWDGDVREALRILYRERLQNVDCQPMNLLKLATIKGCKDPLVLCEAHYQLALRADILWQQKDYLDAQDAMAQSKYPAAIQCKAILDDLYGYQRNQMAPFDGRPGRRTLIEVFNDNPRIDARLKQAMQILVDDAAAHPDHEDAIINAFLYVVGYYQECTGSKVKAIYAVYPSMVRAFPDNFAAYLVRGRELSSAGWDKRGTRLAIETTDEQFQTFGEYLAAAESSLTKAWELDPSNQEICREMLNIGMGLGYPPEKEAQWCARAMAIDPLGYAGVNGLIAYQQPRWLGTREEMIQTARDYIAKNKRPDSLVRLSLIDAQIKVLDDMHLHDEFAYDFQILSKKEIWDPLAADYEAYLKDNPTAYKTRYDYARLAAVGLHFDVAKAQMIIIGDHLNDDLPKEFLEIKDFAFHPRHALLHAYAPYDNELKGK